MNATVVRVEDIEVIGRREGAALAVEELGRAAEALRPLGPEDWQRPTDCPAWDVRALAAHVLGGAEAFASTREFVHQMRRSAAGAKRGEVFVDVMTALQVRERASLTTDEVVARLEAVGPRAAQWRRRFPLRFVPMDEEVDGRSERWTMAYLIDRILNRDTWMHRVDLARATGRAMVLTPEHDGRIVADAVAEWAQRHGRSFSLTLDGPAGGDFISGDGDERLRLDAVEFCRILSGRAPGEGLLDHPVPF